MAVGATRPGNRIRRAAMGTINDKIKINDKTTGSNNDLDICKKINNTKSQT